MRTDQHIIRCTGDACTGDHVSFERAVFSGRYPKSKFSHMEHVTGLIIRDSYGKDKQQHTFTISDDHGGEFRIKGRNLYRNECHRKEWTDESLRNVAIEVKHKTGDKARTARALRKASDQEGYYRSPF